jgi:hypothetical protein
MRPNLFYCQTVVDFLLGGKLTGEKAGLHFTLAASAVVLGSESRGYRDHIVTY